MELAFEHIPKEFVSKTAFCDYKTPITEVIDKISRHGAIVVMNGKQYYGILDSRSVARKGGVSLMKGSAVRKFAKRVPAIDSTTTIKDAVSYLYNSSSKALPYFEKERVAGIVRREELLKAILSLHLLSDSKVGDVMSTPLIAIESGTSVSQAKTLMQQNRINRLLVNQGTGSHGLLTYSNISKYYARAKGRAPKYERQKRAENPDISSIVENNPYTIEHDSGVEDAIRMFVEKDISSLPVVKKGKPVGMLTIKDVFESILSSGYGKRKNIEISGLDRYTLDYGADIERELERLESKIDRFHGIGVERMSLHVKRAKARNYDIKLRLWLDRKGGGAISASATGFSLEKTLRDVTEKAYNFIKDDMKIVYAMRKRKGSSE